jgi:hypothetical protein
MEIKMNKGVRVSGSVVTTVLSNYFDKSHVLYIGKWYGSPTFEFLYEKQVHVAQYVQP